MQQLFEKNADPWAQTQSIKNELHLSKSAESGLCDFFYNDLVGASSLAMDVNDDAGNLMPRSALGFFASGLAPTGTPKTKPLPAYADRGFGI